MSGGGKPALSDDEARVQIQMSQTEISRISASMVPGSGGGAGPFGSTSFEGRELNSMIDLVDSANHADLENAGNALWKARDALKEAARELKGYIDEVEWQGDSGAAFKVFGTNLAKHAVSLADFADVAGTQITVAGTGLASVRSSMPARDGRLIRKKVEDIPLPGRIEGNADYAAAVKVEKDRQEAINQMYRLASFYAVSEERLAAQEPPQFDGALKANVPPPTTDRELIPGSQTVPSGAHLSGGAAPQSVAYRTSDIGTQVRSEGFESTPGPDRSVTVSAADGGTGRVSASDSAILPDRDASLEINSVSAPAVPRESSAPAPVGSGGPTSPGSGSGFTPSYVSNGVSPFQSGAPRSAGSSGVPRAVGRSGGPGSGAAAAGSSASGRPGAGGSVGPRGGRAEGVVGGNPRAAGGSSGSRVPRGTVVGGEGVSPGRSTGGRTGQPGVVGANPAKGSARAGGRGAASSNGVVGTPRGGTNGTRPRGGGFTQGGAGLVRGPGRSGSEKDEQEPTASSRPDYLTEDEETWTGRRRGAVPPVVE